MLASPSARPPPKKKTRRWLVPLPRERLARGAAAFAPLPEFERPGFEREDFAEAFFAVLEAAPFRTLRLLAAAFFFARARFFGALLRAAAFFFRAFFRAGAFFFRPVVDDARPRAAAFFLPFAEVPFRALKTPPPGDRADSS
jgi:hypothetical protein